MQNIKYHIINTTAVIIFSYLAAITANQFIKLYFAPAYTDSGRPGSSNAQITMPSNFENYNIILDSGFFSLAGSASETGNANGETDASAIESDLKNFELLGTISGPASIARALIKKKGEKDSEIFKLWSDVYGYKLIRIDNSKIYLKKNEKVEIIDMYAKLESEKQSDSANNSIPANGTKTRQTISRSEIQSLVLNNMDKALEGLRAGPYKVNNVIEGYKLFRVRPGNILYKLGARSGDIAKRINGHPINSTEKLLSMWQSIQGESKITVDIDRGGKIVTYELNITD